MSQCHYVHEKTGSACRRVALYPKERAEWCGLHIDSGPAQKRPTAADLPHDGKSLDAFCAKYRADLRSLRDRQIQLAEEAFELNERHANHLFTVMQQYMQLREAHIRVQELLPPPTQPAPSDSSAPPPQL